MTKKIKQNIKCRTGDIVAIPLSDGRFAYARAYKRLLLGIYRHLTNSLEVNPQLSGVSIVFHAWCVTTPIENGRWPIVGNIPFAKSSDAEPPPMYIQDAIDPTRFKIVHLGKVREATADGIIGLDQELFYKPEQLIARIEAELPEIIAAEDRRTPRKSR